MSFEAEFKRIGDETSPFCLGIDPAPGLLTAAGLTDDRAGLRIFYERLLDATHGLVSVVKPQVGTVNLRKYGLEFGMLGHDRW